MARAGWKSLLDKLSQLSGGDAPARPVPVRDEFGPEAVARIQRIARDSVLEPFAVHRNLETLKKTRQKIESSVRKLGGAARAAGSGLSKTGAAVRSGWNYAGDTKWGARLKQRIASGVKSGLEIGTGSASPAASGDESADWSARLRVATTTLAAVAKSTYEEANRWASGPGIGYLEEGFRLLLDRDGERWILKRARKILRRNDLHQLEDVRGLSFVEREQLIDALYPYRSPALRKYVKALDQALNFSLGAVVASNLPLTGAAVGALNIVKTILKIGGRLSTMTWLYGGRIAGPGALFRVSAQVLQSLEAWESDPDHVPLAPDVLDGLFVQEESSKAFREMLEAAIRKDAYIVVPGVGTVGVGKIPLDDFRMDIHVQRLVMNYFERDDLRELAGAERYTKIHDDFTRIYRELLARDAVNLLYERARDRRPAAEGRDLWLARWKSLTGTDGIAEEISAELDAAADRIYRRMETNPQAVDIPSWVAEALG